MFRFDQAFLNEFKVNKLILAIGFCCLLFGMSVGAFSMPFVYPEVIQEFGWTREQATLLASAKYAVTAASALTIGRLLDYVGTWVTLMVMMALAGFALISYLWVEDLGSYYLTAVMLGVASGGGIVSVKVMVSKAFHASQGTAMGITLLGIAIGASIVPLIVTATMGAFGWRLGLASLSVTIWAIAIPLLIFGRGSLAKLDSDRASALSGGKEDYAPRVWDLFGQRNFWLIATVVFGASVVDYAFAQHQVLIFRDLNFSEQTTAWAVSMIGLAGIFSRVLVGNILDSKSNKGLAALYLTMTVASLAALALTHPLVLVVFIVLRAVGHSAVLLDTAVMSKHAYGNSKNMGILLGMFTAFSSAGFATGPWLMGRIFDATGSYAPAYIAFAVLPVLLAIIAWMIRPTFWLKVRAGA